MIDQDEHDEYAARCDFEAHARTEEEHRREIETAIAQAVAAEREAVRAEIGQRMSTLLNEFVASESRANAINGELRALRLLVEWLDARSKGGAK